MTTPSIDRITLERTGQAPIAFAGSLIAEASGRTINAPAAQDNSDWWDISIYQTAAPESVAPYVAAIKYTNDHRGRMATQQFASLTDDPASVLVEYDPLSVLRGFPPGPQYAERQKNLEKNCRVQYDMLVSSVLKLFPEETAAEDLTSEDRVSMTTDVTITLRRDGDGYQWHATMPPTATDDDRAAVADALMEAADQFSPDSDDDGSKDLNEACCSAMRMIRLLSLGAPQKILEGEILNLTRLVECVCKSRPE